MSGDNIYMDYYSRLGPIDSQVQCRQGQMVPALGYLVQWERLVKISLPTWVRYTGKAIMFPSPLGDDKQMDDEFLQTLLQKNSIDVERLRMSRDITAALRQRGVKRRQYSLRRPDHIQRVAPVMESSAVRRFSVDGPGEKLENGGTLK